MLKPFSLYTVQIKLKMEMTITWVSMELWKRMQRKNCGNQESCSLRKNAKIQTLGTHNLLYKLTLNLFTIFATVVETTKFILCAVEFQNIRGKYVFRKILQSIVNFLSCQFISHFYLKLDFVNLF